MLNKNRLTKILENDEIRKIAPSVFAENAWSETSERYRFLPTIEIVNALRDNGYSVVLAGQSRSRIEGKKEAVKHILRMRHNSMLSVDNVGDEVPEIVLINSHDKTSSYKLMLGIFRFVCTNGLVVASQTIDSINVRHSGSRDLLSQVIDVSSQVISEAPKAMAQIERFKSITLNAPERLALANASTQLMQTVAEVRPESLLRARRYEDIRQDGTSSLWQATNVIQENIIRGGAVGRSENGGLRRTRAVNCIKNNVDINKALWRLTEELAKIKS